jgi:hypothetical protein
MNARVWLTAFALGLGLTILTLGVAYPCCLNGAARGLPFPIWLPRCEATRAAVALSGSPIHVVDLVRGAADVLLWGGLVLGVQSRLKRRRTVPL